MPTPTVETTTSANKQGKGEDFSFTSDVIAVANLAHNLCQNILETDVSESLRTDLERSVGHIERCLSSIQKSLQLLSNEIRQCSDSIGASKSDIDDLLSTIEEKGSKKNWSLKQRMFFSKKCYHRCQLSID